MIMKIKNKLGSIFGFGIVDINDSVVASDFKELEQPEIIVPVKTELQLYMESDRYIKQYNMWIDIQNHSVLNDRYYTHPYVLNGMKYIIKKYGIKNGDNLKYSKLNKMLKLLKIHAGDNMRRFDEIFFVYKVEEELKKIGIIKNTENPKYIQWVGFNE